MEVVVVAAIGTIIMLAMTTMFSELFKNQARLQHQAEAFNFAEEVRTLLAKPETCLRNFQGRNVTAETAVGPMLKEDGSTAFAVGSKYENGKVLLGGMALAPFAPDSAGTLTGKTDVRLELTNSGTSSVQVVRFVGLRMEVDSSNQVVRCFAVNVRTDRDWTVWQRVLVGGTSTDNIYFGAGNVGIGTSSPSSALHIVSAGNSAIFERNGKRMFIDANNSDLNTYTQLQTDSGMGFMFRTNGGVHTPLYLDVDGGVGVGVPNPRRSLVVYESTYGIIQSVNAATGVGMNDGFMLYAEGLNGRITNNENGPIIFYINGADRANIDPAGNVTALAYLNTSDERLKKNISPLEEGYAMARALQGVSFNWIETGKKDIGLIAQQVEAVAPALVSTDAKGMKSVKYANVVAILIEAFKAQDKKIEDLSERLQALEERNKKVQ